MRDKRNDRTLKSRQAGATLFVGLIMLVLLTLLAVSAFNTSSVQLRIIGNMQAKQDAHAAANQAIGQVLSSADFSINPTAVTAAPISVDINQDTVSDYTVTVKPVCVRSVTILNTELDVANPEDLKCFAGGHFGGGAGAGVYSNCSNSTWDIEAKAVDTTTSGTVTTVHQGVKRRVSRGTEDSFCK